jgi:hypothetical protein
MIAPLSPVVTDILGVRVPTSPVRALVLGDAPLVVSLGESKRGEPSIVYLSYSSTRARRT